MRLPTSCLAARQRQPPRQATLICSLVIALSSALVISTVQSTSIGDKPAGAIVAPPQSSPASVDAAAKADVAAVKPKDVPVEAKSAAAPAPEAKVSAEAVKALGESEQARKGRSEAPSDLTSKQTTDKPADSASKTGGDKAAAQRPAEQQKSAPAASNKPASSSSSSSPSSSGKAQLSGKSGASTAPSSSSGKKLPANLGTVTSTGSGGPAHYMSKHDAYSAIAEKHGALAQDAVRKSDKRQHHTSSLQQRFGGIQKASGFGDALNPFKGDSGLARTLGASVRSIMKGKYSVPAYLASAVLGAVALMAFYESPISPLPVPALPEPPVGRFPPEMPVISPNLQVPFRTNQGQGQQQGYGQMYGQQNGYANQRSSSVQQAGQPMAQQQPQQVLFPGASAQAAQQRQGTAPGPVQQLAANLISSVGSAGRPAQARSDLDVSSSRSFFGSSHHQQAGAGKLGAPANQQAHKQQSGLLSFLGLGGGGGTSGSGISGPAGESTAAGAASSQPVLSGLADIHRASGLSAHHVGAGGGPVASAPGHEHKGQSLLSNSHLVNKMKSYFDRPVAHSSWSMDHNVPNQYDQYRRMSIMQALAKDTAFLSSFFTPSRRSSNSSSPISASQLQQSISSVLAAATGGGSPAPAATSQQVAAARMQVDSMPAIASLLPFQQQQQQQQQSNVNTKRASSGYGLMRAADRIGHALLDTFTSGLLHRSANGGEGASARKAAMDEQQQQNALASATSLLSDIMTSYNAAQASAEAQSNAHQAQASVDAGGKQQPEQASGRSADQQPGPVSAPAVEQQQQSAAPGAQHQVTQAAKPQPAALASPEQTNSAQAQPQQQQQQPLSRKTRSVGLDYALEQIQPQPSRASQINNLVDFVSDSYKQNKLLFSFVMNQVGLSQALPYVDQFLGTPNEPKEQ